MNVYVGDEVWSISVPIRPVDERRIEVMLAKMDRALAEAFADFLKAATSRDAVEDLIALIEAGRIDEAADFASRYSEPLGLRIAEAYKAAGQFEILNLTPPVAAVQEAAGTGGGARLPPSITSLFDRLPKPTVAIAFDYTNPRAAEAMRRAKEGFLTAFNESQREAIRTLLSDALATGEGAREAARQIRDIVGLSKRQVEALDRYRQALAEGRAEALTGATRDRRYDRTVRKAVSGEKPLTQAQIDAIVDARRRRMIRYRGEMIAREESARAMNMGREEALTQMVEKSGINPANVTREWRSLRDSRVRDTHIAMDGQSVPMGGYFVSPSGARLRFPKDPLAPEHETAGCRCFLVTKIKQPD